MSDFLGEIPPRNEKKLGGLGGHSVLNILVVTIFVFCCYVLLAHYLYCSIIAPAFGFPIVDFNSFLSLVVVVRLLLAK